MKDANGFYRYYSRKSGVKHIQIIRAIFQQVQNVITNKTLNLQTEAIINWPGACNQLDNITQQTLVIVGTDDVLTVPANSLLIAERIPGAWFVQMEGRGQGLVYQYPERFSDLVLTFLATD